MTEAIPRVNRWESHVLSPIVLAHQHPWFNPEKLTGELRQIVRSWRSSKYGATAYGQGLSPHEETRSRSIAQRDLSRSASLQEEWEIRRDKGKKSEHEVADRRCTTLFSAKWVLIDPGTYTEKKGGPSKEPVPGDHYEAREKHARG